MEQEKKPVIDKQQIDAFINEEPSEKVDEVLRKYEVEARYRKFTGPMAKIIAVIAIAMSLFHLYTAGIGVFEAIKQRSIHLTFVLVLVFLLYPATSKSPKAKVTPIDVMLAALSFFAGVYLMTIYDDLANAGGVYTQMDIYVGGLLCLLVLEAARRATGKELPIMALLFVGYALFGDLIPGQFGHRGYSLERVIEHMFLTTEGIYGVALGVSATYIFLFILFGAFLSETGMARFFNSLAMAVAGGSPGGPAKVAIFASGLLGMINGSAVANTATIGSFTIPLMKSIGYRPHFAGAVEAVASTGGQIMPPVMGAAAFVMAEFLGMSYTAIMIAAVVPAALYYLACWTMIHLEALKLGLEGLPKEQLPSFKNTLLKSGHLMLPILAIVALLLYGLTPLYAAFFTILITIVVSWLKPETRISFRGILKALEAGARSAVGVAMACAVVGFVVGVSSLTSLGLTFGANILDLSGNSLMLTLVLTAITSLILGMGLPTTACYIVAATIAAPALIKLSVPPLVAHFFVFYFACLSNLTPPVCLAAFTAAGMAGASPYKVGWTSTRLGVAGFLVPFLAVYSPMLLLQGNFGAFEVGEALLTATVGIIALSAALENWLLRGCTLPERAVLLVGALCLIIPGFWTDIIGLGSVIAVYLWQKRSLSNPPSTGIAGN
ncbi:TRAP transporter permease [Anaeroselena agilis]|uniref:TRAP transporter permease n=1 Tax=Anaeroselena agilis TaxID=3063788 RepID=A0ABU3P3X6_9FIRM|nr:TRAP transporter permease [Selenomonadales bacterium 4137-cl]